MITTYLGEMQKNVQQMSKEAKFRLGWHVWGEKKGISIYGNFESWLRQLSKLQKNSHFWRYLMRNNDSFILKHWKHNGAKGIKNENKDGL